MFPTAQMRRDNLALHYVFASCQLGWSAVVVHDAWHLIRHWDNWRTKKYDVKYVWRDSVVTYVTLLLGSDKIQRSHLTSIWNPIVEIRRSYDRHISTMGFPILVRQHLYIESVPWSLFHWHGLSAITYRLLRSILTHPCSIPNWQFNRLSTIEIVKGWLRTSELSCRCYYLHMA